MQFLIILVLYDILKIMRFSMIELKKKVKEQILTRKKNKKNKSFLMKKVFIPIAFLASIYGVANNYIDNKIESTVSSSDYNTLFKYNSGKLLSNKINTMYNSPYSEADFKQDLEIKNEFDKVVKQEFIELNKQFKINNKGQELFEGNINKFFDSFRKSNQYGDRLDLFYSKKVAIDTSRNRDALYLQKADFPYVISFISENYSNNHFLDKIIEKNIEINHNILLTSQDPIGMQAYNIDDFLINSINQSQEKINNTNYYKLSSYNSLLNYYLNEYKKDNITDKITKIRKSVLYREQNDPTVVKFVDQQLERLRIGKEFVPYTLNDDNIKSSLHYLRISNQIINEYRKSIYDIINKNKESFSSMNKLALNSLSTLNDLRLMASYVLTINPKDHKDGNYDTDLLLISNKFGNNHYDAQNNDIDRVFAAKTFLSGISEYNITEKEKRPIFGGYRYSTYYMEIDKNK